MSKDTPFHMNPETGETGKCDAKVQCPFQKVGDELGMTTHFKTLDEVNSAGESRKTELFGAFGVIDGDKSKSLVMSNKKLTSEELKMLVAKNDPDIEKQLSLRSDLDMDTVRAILSDNTIRNLCANQKLPKEAYSEIFEAITGEERKPELEMSYYSAGQYAGILGTNPSVSYECLEKIFADRVRTMSNFKECLENPNMTSELIDKIFQKGKKAKYWFYGENGLDDIAGATKTSPETLREIAQKGGKVLTVALKDNPNLPAEIKQELETSNEFTKIINAENSTAEDLKKVITADYDKTFPNIMKEISYRDALIRGALKHPNLGEEYYSIAIINLHSNDLSDMYRQRTELPDKLVDLSLKYINKNITDEKKNRIILRHVLNKGQNITAEQLRELAEKGVSHKELSWCLPMAARHKNMPPEILKRLSANRLIAIKEAVASNESTPKDILIKYSKMKNDNLLMSLAKNPKLPVEAQMELAKTGNVRAVSHIATALLENPAIDGATLDVLADSSFTQIKEKALNHPNVPMKTILRKRMQNTTSDDDE